MLKHPGILLYIPPAVRLTMHTRTKQVDYFAEYPMHEVFPERDDDDVGVRSLYVSLPFPLKTSDCWLWIV